MTLQDAISLIPRGKCILFTGSGFSLGATFDWMDDGGKPIGWLTAEKVTKILAGSCGVSEQRAAQLGLKKVADYFAKTKGKPALCSIIKKLFSVVELTKDQKFIGALPWKRIYTTNYDLVFEKAAEKAGIAVASLSPSSPRAGNNGKFCMHLNGSIHNLTPEKINEELKLTSESYNGDEILANHWFDFFKQDILDADAIFFIGFSGDYDLDITRILFQRKELKEKSFYIVKPGLESIDMLAIEEMGKPEPIGLEGLVAEMKSILGKEGKATARNKKSPKILFPETYKSFRKILPFSARPAVTAEDRRVYYAKGDYDEQIIDFAAQFPEDFSYTVFREKLERIEQDLRNGKRFFLVKSSLGNGKSTFLLSLAYRLTRQNRQAFFFDKGREFMIDEIKKICTSYPNPVLIFDNFTFSISDIRKIRSFCEPNASIILADRTARIDTRNWIAETEMEDEADEIMEISLEKLSDKELKVLNKYFNSFGFWGSKMSWSEAKKMEYLSKTCKSELSKILLGLLNSEYVQGEFQKILSELESRSRFHEPILILLLATYLQSSADFGDIMDLIGANISNSSTFRNDPNIKEIVAVNEERMILTSSLLAEALLTGVRDKDLLADFIISIHQKLDRMASGNRTAKNFIKALMPYRVLKKILGDTKKDSARIYRVYESMAEGSYTQNRQLFWLQCAIARTVYNSFENAEIYFQNAYSLAAANGNFDTYQIDNHYAHYLLRRAIHEKTCNWHRKEDSLDPASPIALFLEVHEYLSRRHKGYEYLNYMFKVAEEYPNFWKIFNKDFSSEDKRLFSEACAQMAAQADEYLKRKGVSDRAQIKRIKARLLAL